VVIGRDLGRLLFEASDSELNISDCERLRSDKAFRVLGSSVMVTSGGGSEMDFESRGSLRGST